MCVINKIKTSDLTQNEFRNYFDLLPIYSLGDIRDILILLGFLFDMDLEGLYSKMLHENVTQNQLQIQNNSYRINSNNVIFEAERYSFNYESRILNLVAKGDRSSLKARAAWRRASHHSSPHRRTDILPWQNGEMP